MAALAQWGTLLAVFAATRLWITGDVFNAVFVTLAAVCMGSVQILVLRREQKDREQR